MNKKKAIQVQVADDSSWDLEPEIYSIVQKEPQGNRPQGQGYAPRQAIQGGRFPPQISQAPAPAFNPRPVMNKYQGYQGY